MSSFNKIAGYEKEKAELATLVEIFNHRKRYLAKGATLPKGIIFYGEAGTGKTLFAEVLSKECALNHVKINLSESASENNICKQIRKAFAKGSKAKVPTMIFFDELDKVLPNEDEEYYTDRSKSILTQLLTLIDGMDTVNNIVFVATCNNYHSLPQSITRPGRFDKKIGLGLPNQTSRVAILTMYIENSPAEFAMNPESIAKLCTGFSCAALKTLVNECLLRSDENNFVSEELIREKIIEIKEEDIPTDKPDESYTLDATRNIGSFVVSHTYSNSSYILNTESETVCNSFLDGIISGCRCDDDDDDDFYNDNDEFETDDKPFIETFAPGYCKNDYVRAITSLLGGYVAEELIFNKTYDNLAVNVKIIDRLLLKMSECGMLGLDLIVQDYRYTDIPYSESILEKLYQVFNDIISICYNKAKTIVEKNLSLISKLVPILIRRKTIEKSECEQIIAELGGIRT